MTRRKFYYLLSWLLVAALVCLTIVCIVTFNPCYFAAFSVVSVVFAWADHMYTKEKDKDNPLNLSRVRRALSFAVGKGHGTKEEFIAFTSEEMYEYCLNQGFIHELIFSEGRPEWEITKVGRRQEAVLED